jgi:DNA-binding transcriptional LysR family regulator
MAAVVCMAQGQLVQVLPQYHTPDADIYAVYPAQHKSAARVRAFVDFVAEAFRPARPSRWRLSLI